MKGHMPLNISKILFCVIYFRMEKIFFLFQITHCGVELGVNKYIILISCKVCSVIRPFTFFFINKKKHIINSFQTNYKAFIFETKFESN